MELPTLVLMYSWWGGGQARGERQDETLGEAAAEGHAVCYNLVQILNDRLFW